MELSIIIPVYNTPKEKIEKCIKSVINLENINYEIIVIDDGSKEECSAEYVKILGQNSKVTYKKIANQGVSNARNLGIDIATGKFIMFVDSDDMIFSKNILKEYISIDADVVLFNRLFITNENEYNKKELESAEGIKDVNEILKEFSVDKCFHEPTGKLYNRKFLKENNIKFDISIIQGEDAIFNLDILLLKPRVYYIDKTIYGYYYDFETLNNRWKNNPQKMFENFMYLKKRKKEVLDMLNFSDKDDYKKKFNYQLINNSFQSCMTLTAYNDWKTMELFSQYFEQKEIEMDNMSSKIKLEYKLIKNKHWKMIYILNKIRNVYLKYYKRKY